VASFLVLLLVFTLFELLGDILKHHVSPLVVGAYLLNVVPYFLYNTLNMCVLLTVVVTFGILQRNNESHCHEGYRDQHLPHGGSVLVMAAFLAAGCLCSTKFICRTPTSARTRCAMRSRASLRKPTCARTGSGFSGKTPTSYYYQFFDSDKDRFANISVFQFDPVTFEVTKRIYAARAHWEPDLKRWIFQQGWERSLRGAAI